MGVFGEPYENGGYPRGGRVVLVMGILGIVLVVVIILILLGVLL